MHWRLRREARERAPLDRLDVSGATVAPIRTPDGWPSVSTVTTPAVAAAYASLADDRALTGALMGELLVVAGGAALGAGLPDLLGLEWRGIAVVLLGFGAVVVGLVCRTRATRRWVPVGERYLARYRELTAPSPEQPAAAVPVSRRGWIVELLGLRRRRRPG